MPAHLFLWGDGGCGQLGMGEDVLEKYRPALLNLPDGKKVLQVACGGMHTVALAEDGTVYTWGVNDEGALGRETEGELWTNAAQATGTWLRGHLSINCTRGLMTCLLRYWHPTTLLTTT